MTYGHVIYYEIKLSNIVDMTQSKWLVNHEICTFRAKDTPPPHTATYYDTLQHTATHCNTLPGGQGAAWVFADETWCFNLVKNTWTLLEASLGVSLYSPPASHLALVHFISSGVCVRERQSG